MVKPGQIIEIPSSSPIFEDDHSTFSSKLDELNVNLQKRNYGLFDGFLVGEHQGTHHFKLGQRKGINVGGKKAPLYVIGINEETNQLFVGQGEDHPGLWTRIITFNKNQIDNLSSIEDGIIINLKSEAFEEKISGKLYLQNDTVMLELEKPLTISVYNHPLDIITDHQIISRINLI
ncbi:tRNA methyl transferase PRC-barrel domain-containing protein [Epilithonimonas xixisoli]|uniref:tRNA methyltransferase n=1 Tax=Epilithonimonas xixisoli TaxID=1476462 RepID=A0A4R8IKD3_9FLAO|nr:tRNA methyl transferase PRC-barrel domain-containing protein [Epilithonimonas xixisoli]TDX87119.1 tRNA methyltransferase [Epilithonimonas xixisoli]